MANVAAAEEGSSPAAPPGPENASRGGAEHTDPFSYVLLELAIVFALAMLGRWVASRLGQPSVLGELLIGVAVCNIGCLLGMPFFLVVMHLGSAGPIFLEVWSSGQTVAEAAGQVFSATELAPGGIGHRIVQIITGENGPYFLIVGFALWLFSNLGVILLLFMAGLHSSVSEMLETGPRAAGVAVVGIVAPFVLGLAASTWLLPELPMYAHLFFGATLCATSVGITARIFEDLGKLRTRTARTILAAAVIDDVLG